MEHFNPRALTKVYLLLTPIPALKALVKQKMSAPNSSLGTSCLLLVAAKSPGTALPADGEGGCGEWGGNGVSPGKFWELVQGMVNPLPYSIGQNKSHGPTRLQDS